MTRVQTIWAALAFILTGLIACAPAEAEPAGEPNRDWVSLVDQDGFRVDVDRKSLKREGARVRSEIRMANDEPDKTPGNRDYVDTLQTRVDDCTTGAFFTELFVYRSADGAVVEENRRKNPRPISNDPGSVAAHINASICELSGLPAPLVANIPLNDVKSSDWRRLPPDPTDGSVTSVLASSPRRLDEAATIVIRTDFTRDQRLPDGAGFRTMVSEVVFTCEVRMHSFASNDFYSEAGKLLRADHYDVVKVARRTEPGPLMEQLRKIACAAPAGTS